MEGIRVIVGRGGHLEPVLSKILMKGGQHCHVFIDAVLQGVGQFLIKKVSPGCLFNALRTYAIAKKPLSPGSKYAFENSV